MTSAASPIAKSMSARVSETDALLALGRWLQSRDCRFTTVTPATHARVNARAGTARALTLRDIFGWSRPFDPKLLDDQVLDWLHQGDLLGPAPDGQLPLHLPITSYELDELGLDPYYFTLHVTVDNGDTGHARRACQAVLDTLPRLDDGGAFWMRVREGSKLAGSGVGTIQVIQEFDIDAEVLRILARKSGVGNGAHSDYCRVAGRSVNDWLSMPENIPAFVRALEQGGWIRRGEPADNSRFWKLLQGERADMFGVFSSYELQVIHDWILGPASCGGHPYAEFDAPVDVGAPSRPRSFRVAERLAQRDAAAQNAIAPPLLDADLSLLQDQLQNLDAADRNSLLIQAMSPVQHWTPTGLYATRLFVQALRG